MTDEPDSLGTLVEPWDTEELGVVAETPIFALRRRRARSRTNADKAGEFFYIDSCDWVNVIAITADGRVVLIEQFRHGRREITVEIPGGMVDPGEDPLTAGIRELREESGYEGSRARLIGHVTPNPAMLNNRCHTVLVEDAVLSHSLDLDGNEEIGARLCPLDQIWSLIRDGSIDHALVVAAFCHYALLESGGAAVAEGAVDGV